MNKKNIGATLALYPCPVSLRTSRLCKMTAFLLIFFHAWNIIKSWLDASNQLLPP